MQVVVLAAGIPAVLCHLLLKLIAVKRIIETFALIYSIGCSVKLRYKFHIATLQCNNYDQINNFHLFSAQFNGVLNIKNWRY